MCGRYFGGIKADKTEMYGLELLNKLNGRRFPMPGKQSNEGGTIISFGFAMDEHVLTPFGEKAIVSMLGFDEGGNTYYVKTVHGGSWFKENQLSKIQ
jgi:hypothetical protein